MEDSICSQLLGRKLLQNSQD
uniref:Uncharacterized protein n=1 Tax=Rhizophora mucronata TaxID=61149 RepID=A0A2P2QC39_RHIMU